ncbi:unnamed protein product [Rangifer tarandus platyrhynchus]|uniref:Uncharacterized protein n=2 Tax=Rangifer tarandus platyrhynchus TaxID=3082113 RepID=A0ABN8ZGS7_RANTA|nr:unnamed protein product [Rangifer tarandus platyrhynchus]
MPVYSPRSPPQTFPEGGLGLRWTPTPEMTWEDASLVTWALRAYVPALPPVSSRGSQRAHGRPRLGGAPGWNGLLRPACPGRSIPQTRRELPQRRRQTASTWGLKTAIGTAQGARALEGAHLVSPRTLLADGRRQLSPLGRVIIFFRLPSG